MPDRLPQASIGGQSVPLADAVARAAAILGASRCAAVAGLDTDVAGVEAAVDLARRIGGAIDHLHAEAALRDLEVMRQDGWIVTTPLQARARADVLLFVGPGIAEAWPGYAERLRVEASPPLMPDQTRRVILLGTDATASGADMIDASATDLPATLGVLRALAAGRKVRPGHRHADVLGRCAKALGEARYGVAIWSAAGLDGLSIEMLCGLVGDLNRATRFAGLPLTAADNVAGAAQATAWLTGFPVRVGFGRGTAEHDPWRFDAARMVDSGEADAALWIAATAPPWTRSVPLVALIEPGTSFATPPEVAITVGRAGVDHDAVLYDPDLGTLAGRRATTPSAAPSVAEVLRMIASALPC